MWEVKSFCLFLILRKTGEKRVLTQIAVIIVTNDTNNKHVKVYKRVSRDAFQNGYDEHVDNSTPFYCRKHDIRCKTKGLSIGISFHYATFVNSNL